MTGRDTSKARELRAARAEVARIEAEIADVLAYLAVLENREQEDRRSS